MTKYAHVIALLFSGLFAGFLTGVLVLELSLRAYDGGVYTQVRLVELDALDKLAIATLLPAVIATALLAYRTFSTSARRPVLVALGLLIFVIALTVSVNLPINSDQLDWSPAAPPTNWARTRDRWQIAHAVRTVAAITAFLTLAFAAFRTRTRPDAAAGR